MVDESEGEGWGGDGRGYIIAIIQFLKSLASQIMEHNSNDQVMHIIVPLSFIPVCWTLQLISQFETKRPSTSTAIT